MFILLAGKKSYASSVLLISPGSLCQPPDDYLRPNAVISPNGRIISHGRTSAERAETAGDYYGTWACLAWLTSVPWTRTGGVALWWQLRARGMLIFLIRITQGLTLARSHVFISSRMQQGVRSGDFLFMVLLYIAIISNNIWKKLTFNLTKEGVTSWHRRQTR